MASDPSRSRQLRLDLARAPSYDPDEFLVTSSNERAHAMIDGWPDWPDRSMLLVGPPGAGKSHLGAVWADRTGARIVGMGQSIDPASWSLPIIALLEDCDRADHPEASLFHLLNLAQESGGWILSTARKGADLWGVRTPDLLSRLRRAPVVTMEPPDLGLLKAVMVKLFTDRQIWIGEDVIAYAATHCEQSLEAIATFVTAVDDESLAEGRRITRPLAARTIERLARHDVANSKAALDRARLLLGPEDFEDQGPT